MAEYTDKEIEEINKRLMRAYNEICKLERLLKEGETDATKKISESRRNAESDR